MDQEILVLHWKSAYCSSLRYNTIRKHHHDHYPEERQVLHQPTPSKCERNHLKKTIEKYKKIFPRTNIYHILISYRNCIIWREIICSFFTDQMILVSRHLMKMPTNNYNNNQWIRKHHSQTNAHDQFERFYVNECVATQLCIRTLIYWETSE